MSTEEVAARALEVSAPIAPPPEVVELFDDKSEGLIDSVAVAASTGPSDLGPSVPRVTVVPDMSGDWELARKLFVELNREAIRIPGDGPW